MKNFVKYLMITCLMLFPLSVHAAWDAKPVQVNPDCNQASFYPLGSLCQDSDDGKLYKGTGSAVEEIASGAGTVTKVGDGTCSDGYCLDGSADGGTYIRLYDGTSAYISVTGTVRTLTLLPSNTNAESLVITFGDNNNAVSLGSGTGASVSINGNAGTASALAADGANCNAGNYPLGVDASGAAQSCTAAFVPATPGAIGATTPAAVYASPAISKGPAIITSFDGTVSNTTTTVTFSQAADATKAGWRTSTADSIVGTTIIATPTTATKYITAWTNSTTCTVDSAPTWTGATITSVQLPIATFVDSAGVTQGWMNAAGNVYFVGKVGIGIATPVSNMDVTGPDDVGSSSVDALSVYSLNRTAKMGFNFLGTMVSGSYGIYVNNGTRAFWIDVSGNILTGGLTAAGTSAAKVLAMGSGTAPTTSPADAAQLWVDDIAGGGTAGFNMRTEDGAVYKFGGGTLTVPGAVTAASFSATRTTDPQSLTLYEGTAGLNNFRKFTVPTALTADLTFTYPDAVPTAGQVLAWTAPVTDVSTGSFVLPALSPAGYQVSFTGPTAARSYALPDAAATLARTDAGQTFTGVNIFTAPSITTSIDTGSTSFTAFAGATTLLTLGGTGASASTFAPSTLDATSEVTGAIRTSGGLSAAKQIWSGTGFSSKAATTTGGYIRLLEGSDNGTDYSMLTGIANAGTTAAFTFGGSSTTENLILTIPITTATEATVTSTSGITSIDFTAINIKDVKIITADTDNEAMTAAQMGQVWTNTGDTDGTIFTLPEASTVIGRSVTFVLTVAQTLTINPANGADKILYGGCAAGDAIQADAVGETITLMAIDATNWAVLSVVGTWTDVN